MRSLVVKSGEGGQDNRRSGCNPYPPAYCLLFEIDNLSGLLRAVRCKCLLKRSSSLSQSAFAHLGVPGRHGSRGMAKAPLCQIQVVSAFVEVRRKGMSQRVKGDFLFSVCDAFV